MTKTPDTIELVPDAVLPLVMQGDELSGLQFPDTVVLGGDVSPFEADSGLLHLEYDAELPLELPGALNLTKGDRGPQGYRGSVGPRGVRGTTGKSAYEDWLAQGNTGTLEDFFQAIGGGGSAFLNELIEKAIEEIKQGVYGDIDELTQKQILLQQYVDGQIYESREQMLQSAEALGERLTNESLDRAEAILEERYRWEAGIESESFARDDALQSMAQEIKTWTAGYQGFSAFLHWTFKEDHAGWVDGSGDQITVIDSPTTNDDGWGYGVSEAEPQLVSPSNLSGIDDLNSNRVRMRVRRMGVPAWAGILQWRSTTGDAWSSAKQMTLPEPTWSDGTNEATLTWEIPTWAGPVTQIRILLQQGASDPANYFMYRYVMFGNDTPAASTALVYQEIKVVSDNLSSEANSRELLAAQMRGGYTGTDLDQLTEGLLFSEKQVRATQTGALGESINTLAARLDTGDVATAMQSMRTDINNIDGRVTGQATAIQQVSVKVGEVEGSVTSLSQVTAGLDGRVKALRTVTTNVNGHISGTVTENDGQSSSFSIMATVFRVFSGGTTGLEWQNGYLRAYSGSIQLILGINFGASSDLCFWYGPNVGAANCTRGTGTIWFDNSGNAYFGGTLSAGILKNGAQNTSTQTIGNSLTVGPFRTLGNSRNVILSINRRIDRTKNAMGSDGFVAGSGSNTITVRLFRQIGAGAETLFQTLNAGGTVDIVNEFDGPDRATSTWGSSATYNDSSASNQMVTYRAEIVGYTEQDVYHTSGSFDQQSVSQTLSIISTEE